MGKPFENKQFDCKGQGLKKGLPQRQACLESNVYENSLLKHEMYMLPVLFFALSVKHK